MSPIICNFSNAAYKHISGVQDVVHFETAVPATYNAVRISSTGERSEEISGATVDGNSSKCQ